MRQNTNALLASLCHLFILTLVSTVSVPASAQTASASDSQNKKNTVTLQLGVELKASRTILVCTLINNSGQNFATLPLGLGNSRLVVVKEDGQEEEIYNPPFHGVRQSDLQIVKPAQSLTWRWDASEKCGLFSTLFHKREAGQYQVYWKLLGLKQNTQKMQKEYRSNRIFLLKRPDTFQFPRFEAIRKAVLEKPMPEEQRAELKKLTDRIAAEITTLSDKRLWGKNEKDAPKGINNNLKVLMDEAIKAIGPSIVGAVLLDTAYHDYVREAAFASFMTYEDYKIEDLPVLCKAWLFIECEAPVIPMLAKPEWFGLGYSVSPGYAQRILALKIEKLIGTKQITYQPADKKIALLDALLKALSVERSQAEQKIILNLLASVDVQNSE
jgi:hypothetical protein